MAAGDLQYFQNAAVVHAQALKKVVTQARELRAFWDKLALPGGDTAQAPLINTDLINYATLCSTLQDYCNNLPIVAGDREAIIERIATRAVSQ